MDGGAGPHRAGVRPRDRDPPHPQRAGPRDTTQPPTSPPNPTGQGRAPIPKHSSSRDEPAVAAPIVEEWCCIDRIPLDHLTDEDRMIPPIIVRPERSEEHTSELQSRGHLVCRLL